MFYRAGIQAVLIFGVGTWVLLAAMSKKMEGVHVGFLRQVTRKNGQEAEGLYLEKRGSGEGTQIIRNTYTGDVH